MITVISIVNLVIIFVEIVQVMDQQIVLIVRLVQIECFQTHTNHAHVKLVFMNQEIHGIVNHATIVA
jgi:hypothetical protein